MASTESTLLKILQFLLVQHCLPTVCANASLTQVLETKQHFRSQLCRVCTVGSCSNTRTRPSTQSGKSSTPFETKRGLSAIYGHNGKSLASNQ